MKFRKETSFWCALLVLSLLAFYKLFSRNSHGNGFNRSIYRFLSGFFAATALAVFFLLIKAVKRGKEGTSYTRFRDILAAWLFSSGSIAGWGLLRMFLKKQPFRYSSLWGALLGALALYLLWKFFGSSPKKEEEDSLPKDKE